MLKKKFRFTLRVRITMAMLVFLFIFMQVTFYVVKKASDTIMIRNKVGDLRAVGTTLAEYLLMRNVVGGIEEATEIYEGIPDDVKADPDIRDFSGYFKDYRFDTDPDMRDSLENMLRSMVEGWGMYEICLCIVDDQNEKIVVIVDSDGNPTGYCEQYEFTIMDQNLYDGEYIEADDGSGTMLIGAYSPVLDYEGNLLAYYHVLDYADDIDSSIAAIVWIMGFLIAGLLVILWIYLFIMMGRSVVTPLNRLSNAANNYIAVKKKNDETTYFAGLNIKSNDEIKDLATAMENMESSIHSYVLDIRKAVADRQRMDTELEVAARIQSDMLPEALETDNYEIYSFMRPARVVGGDFYDYFRIDDDRTALVVADVSDKGVPASLFMAIAKTVIKMSVMENQDDLADAVSKANRTLCETNKEMMFVTAFIGIFSETKGTLTYVNAGHERPVLYSASDDSYRILNEEHDLFLAVDPDVEFTPGELLLHKGDRFIQYTDGVTEAMDVSDNEFGEEGFLRILNEDTSLRGNDLINHIWDAVSSFQRGKEQSDDVTIVLLEV